ncbi:unnamed protein product [Chrysoparadoxa australica]
MHTVWVRLNGVVFFGFTVLLCLATLAAFSTYLHEGTGTLNKLQLAKLRSFRTSSGTDRALISFDMDADLTPAFNWNIKQLFVFVVAEYASETNPVNQVILWDKIIQRPEDAHLKNKNVFIKYGLIDQGQELRNNSVTLKMYWDHMPLTGRLFVDSDSKEPFVLPGEYKR